MAGSTKQSTLNHLERLESLVREELAILGQVDALSQRQGSLVGIDDAAPLLHLLDERQMLIERAGEIASEVAMRREACESATTLPTVRWKTLQSDFGAVADLAERIAARDREVSDALARQRAGVAVEISQLDKGRGASAAYGSKSAESRAKYQDRHG